MLNPWVVGNDREKVQWFFKHMTGIFALLKENSLQPVKCGQIHCRQEASVLEVGQGAQTSLHDFPLLRYRLWNFVSRL